MTPFCNAVFYPDLRISDFFYLPGFLKNAEDFESFLSQSKPGTLWGVELQRKGAPKGWNDVGGLNEVRRSLLETLHWPAKV